MEANILILALIGMVVQACILYLVIASASRAKSRSNMEWLSMKLLEKIALKQGVPPEEIRELMNKI